MSVPPTLATIPIWLINLPRSTDRLDHMQKQLGQAGLHYQTFQAVDGRADWNTLKETVDFKAFERNTGRKVMAGEIGCTHSHLAVWRALCATDAPAGLILEDDVVLQSNFKQAVNAALARYTDWDIVKLNAIRSKWPVQQHQLDGYALNAYLGSFTGTGTYLITRTAAARLLPQMLPIKRPIDHELDRSGVHGLRHFGMSPFPSQVLGASESTITGTNYQGVQKFPRWQRMPAYWQRWRNFASKAVHLLRGA